MSEKLLGSKENEDVGRYNDNKERDKTFQFKTVSEKAAPTETYRSFHIADIVPDLFKNHEDSTVVKEGKISSENKQEVREIEPLLEKMATQDSKRDSEDNHSNLENNSTTMKLEEDVRKTDVEVAIGDSVFGFQGKKTVEPESLEFTYENKAYSEMDENYKYSDERMPLLSPDKPLAVSLVELDHSYGLAVPEELAPVCVEETELLEGSIKESLPNDRELTESPVVDIVTVDSALTLLPVPEPTQVPKPQFPIRSFEADDELVYEFHKLGIDAEDCYYLKVGFEQLQQVASDSVVDAHWSSHPHILFDKWISIKTIQYIYSTYNVCILDVLVCSIAVYFYEPCSILASPKGESKYK